MNIAVVAANGRSGRFFVEFALAAGHSVRAGVHGGGTFNSHPNLIIVECDATKREDVDRLIRGQDAVLSFIGHIKGSSPRVQTEAMKVLGDAMIEQKITRLVSLTGTGVRFLGDNITLIDRVLNGAINIIDPARIQDGKDHVAFLQQTNFDWTVIRVLKLQGAGLKTFALTPHGPTKWFVSREEAAQAALQVLEEKSFVRESPIISRS